VAIVTHASIGDDLALMNQGAVDLILTGHDHDLRMIYDGNVAMVESSSQAEFVTVLELTVDRVKKGDKEEVVWRPNFRPIDTAAVTPDPKGAELVKAYDDRLSKELDVPVGKIATGLDSRRATVRDKEAAIGNLIADATREAVGADVAITNGGGIRANKEYPAGATLTRRDILSELPFGNKTVKIEVKGADILARWRTGSRRPGRGRAASRRSPA
jgi:2',3'-cyclic-nucleotide 2'-phosphodiesterase (5'-nucleotidase family)